MPMLVLLLMFVLVHASLLSSAVHAVAVHMVDVWMLGGGGSRVRAVCTGRRPAKRPVQLHGSAHLAVALKPQCANAAQLLRRRRSSASIVMAGVQQCSVRGQEKGAQSGHRRRSYI
eukprot:362051-Chlamydomonas_euryale.AAC.3